MEMQLAGPVIRKVSLRISYVEPRLLNICIKLKLRVITVGKICNFASVATPQRDYSAAGEKPSLYPVLRLLLPYLDRDRGAYGIKESVLADLYVDFLQLGKKSYDAQKVGRAFVQLTIYCIFLSFLSQGIIIIGL